MLSSTKLSGMVVSSVVCVFLASCAIESSKEKKQNSDQNIAVVMSNQDSNLVTETKNPDSPKSPANQDYKTIVSDNDDESYSGYKNLYNKPGQSPGQNPGQTPGNFFEYRTIDGIGNNPNLSTIGSAVTPFLRISPSYYADGKDTPAGSNRPSTREISNKAVAQTSPVPNFKKASDYLWQWGQFLDHDIDLTETADSTESAEIFNISVPDGDPFFGGVDFITLMRSKFARILGVRQQVNSITSFIDASNVYGSSPNRAIKLRTNDGSGKLKLSANGLLPYNDDGLPNAPSPDPSFFVAGDVRANEQLGLTSMHTLFVREHNYLADLIRSKYPSFSGDEIYQLARAIVGAEMQLITYNEFLPVLLGKDALSPYTGYKKWINPSIANEFATAAFRFGHSALPEKMLRLGSDLQPIAAGNLMLKEAFFRPDRLLSEGGIEPMLRGLSKNIHQQIDIKVTDGVRNFLFGAPGQGGFDLPALNIQRGRDHGLPSYTQMRQALKLVPVTSFSQISTDSDVISRLQSAYDQVSKIDLWVGGLAEKPYKNGMVGETFHLIIKDQFERLRDGDRFWYQRHLNSVWRSWVEKQTLASIIRRNTTIGSELQANVFIVP